MEKLERKLASIIKGFRKDSLEIELNQEHVHKWISQFNVDTQEIILNETVHILEKWYFDEDKILIFLNEVIQYLQKGNENRIEENSLKGICFLDIQESGKSQSQLVKMLRDEVYKNTSVIYK